MLNDLPIEKSFHHVKGHQDDKIAYENLTFDARLNVDTDAEAGKYRYNNPEPRPKITRLPSNSAQLHVSGAMISAHYRIGIEKAASATNLREYIRSKNDWTTEQMAYINWDALGKALARLAQRHTQLFKMCHEILPTATITSR
jgi:GH24 family phage-related lysozyme (muramidase)